LRHVLVGVGGIASQLLLLLLMNWAFAKNELGSPVIGGPGSRGWIG
jgi:hypothetical protein